MSNNNHCNANSVQAPQSSDYITGGIGAADKGFQEFIKHFGEASVGWVLAPTRFMLSKQSLCLHE